MAHTVRRRWLALALVMFVLLAREASAQGDPGGFQLRSVTFGSGYTWVQLPPITLGGYVPNDALSEDLISILGATLGWSKVGRDSGLFLTLGGNYTGRVKYTEMSNLGGSASLGASHRLSRTLRASVSASTSLSNSDQISFQSTDTQELLSLEQTYDGLSRAVSYPRSRNPIPSQAALFVPIRQNFVLASQGYGNQTLTRGVSGGLTWSASRLSLFADTSYVQIESITSNKEPGDQLEIPTSTAQVLGAGASYATSRRSSVNFSYSRSESKGIFSGDAASATVGFGWAGRRLFGEVNAGYAFTAYRADASTLGPDGIPLPPLDTNPGVYNFRLGVKSQTQTVMGTYRRAPNDSQGFASLRGSTTGALASWIWTPLRSRWNVQTNFEFYKTPGNFLWINTWHANATLSRQVGRRVRLSVDLMYDRHGSKGFEGFHLVRRGATANLTWLPLKRLF